MPDNSYVFNSDGYAEIRIETPSGYITLEQARNLVQGNRNNIMSNQNLPSAEMLMDLVNEKIRDMERDIDQLKKSIDRLQAMSNKFEADTNRLKLWCSSHEECKHVFEDELPKLKIR